MSKNNIIITVISVAAIIGLVVWLRTTPQAVAPTIIKTTTQTDMKIETITEGTGAEITNGKVAQMEYTGMLTDGKVFDATSLHGGDPFEFTLGAGQVIKGWDLGVLGMKVGEKRRLTIPADLAYGDRGIGGVIPPNATLVFEVVLKGIK